MEYESWYIAGKLVEQKSYDDQEGLMRHEKYAPEIGKLVPVEIPLGLRNPKFYKYQQESANNKDHDSARMALLVVAIIIALFLLIFS